LHLKFVGNCRHRIFAARLKKVDKFFIKQFENHIKISENNLEKFWWK